MVQITRPTYPCPAQSTTYMSDEIPELTSIQRVSGHLAALTFDAERFHALRNNQCLFLVYQLHRWQWHVQGLVPFLTAKEQSQFAVTCYASYAEYYERQTDDQLTLSPLAANGAVDQHIA